MATVVRSMWKQLARGDAIDQDLAVAASPCSWPRFNAPQRSQVAEMRVITRGSIARTAHSIGILCVTVHVPFMWPRSISSLYACRCGLVAETMERAAVRHCHSPFAMSMAQFDPNRLLYEVNMRLVCAAGAARSRIWGPHKARLAVRSTCSNHQSRIWYLRRSAQAGTDHCAAA